MICQIFNSSYNNFFEESVRVVLGVFLLFISSSLHMFYQVEKKRYIV